MTNFDQLPLEIKEKIFFLLPGNCLENCRKVCKSWRMVAKFSMAKNVRKIVDKRFQENCIQEYTTQIFDIEFQNMVIGCVSSHYVLLKSDDLSLAESIVVVYNMNSGNKWKIPHLDDTIISSARDHFQCIMNDRMVAIRYNIENSKEDKDSSIVKLWSMKTMSLIFQESYENCDGMTCDNLYNKRILVIFHQNFEVIIFTENDNEDPTFLSYTINETDGRKYGSLKYPFLTCFQINVSSNITRLHVWKINLKDRRLENIVLYNDANMLAKYSDGNFIIERMENVVFQYEHFWSTSDIEVIHENSVQNIFSYDLVVRVYNVEGYMRKEIKFVKYLGKDLF